ncbi:MAG: integrase core domain-containing protein [Akkermansia muciniphila]|nr:integrase core domain-containing protein [Akkermansia muciniphila]
MTTDLCLKTLDKALESGLLPRVFNTDQGSQYTSREWQARITGLGVQISLDGRGRWQDNARMERFWRSLKHECFLLHDFERMEEAAAVCGKWIKYYNEERPHQELGNLSPDEWLAEQLKSPFIGEGAVREERAEAPLSLSAPSLRSETLGERGEKKA